MLVFAKNMGCVQMANGLTSQEMEPEVAKCTVWTKEQAFLIPFRFSEGLILIDFWFFPSHCTGLDSTYPPIALKGAS